MLIESHRHTAADLELWREYEAADLRWYASNRIEAKSQKALDTIVEFTRKPCYAGISWGKDSTVLAHLLHRVANEYQVCIPSFWIVVNPICNPDCEAVEDNFLERHYLDYRRIKIECRRDLLGVHATGTLEAGFSEAMRLAKTERHLSGVRGDESGQRDMRMRTFGTMSIRTCAPIGWWSAKDVFAYLAYHKLPVHPAYGMLGGGRWQRDRLRVASLGGKRGTGIGRAEWEQEYYSDALNRLASSVK